MIGLEILWAVLCLGMMGWSFWRFGKSLMEADQTIQRDKEMAEYYAKIAENRREELAAETGELAPVIQERDRLRAEVDEIERQISFKAQFERRHLFLLTDRRTPEDREWHVPASLREGFGMIWHPAVTRSWLQGRRIVIWAKTKEIAKRAVTARLPESSGFLIGEPIEGHSFPALARPAMMGMNEAEEAGGDPTGSAIETSEELSEVPAGVPPASADDGASAEAIPEPSAAEELTQGAEALSRTAKAAK